MSISRLLLKLGLDLKPNSYRDFSFPSYLGLTHFLPVMAKKVSQSQVTQQQGLSDA